MILQSAFTLPVPLEEAFDLLVDATAVAGALPGARPAGPGATEGALTIDGLLDGGEVTLHGRVSALERDRVAGAISFHATAVDDGGDRAIAAGAVRLRDAGGVTAVAIQLDLETTGRLAAATPEAVEAAVRRLVDGLAAGLRERTTPSRPAGQEADQEAGDEPRDPLEVSSEHWETVGYAWMTDASTAPAIAIPWPTAARTAPPRPTIAPRPPRRAEARSVPGRVEIVTSGPVAAAGIPVGDGPAARLEALQRDRPWLAPAMALSAIAVVMLVRRRDARAGG